MSFQVHSITARSVPKEQLAQLRSIGQEEMSTSKKVSSLQSSPSTDSQDASLVLEMDPANPVLIKENQRLQQSSRPHSSSIHSSNHQQQVFPASNIKHIPASQDRKAETEKNKISSAQVLKRSSSPHKQKPARMVVRRASDAEDVPASPSGPRIRAGVISARTAFWERKMAEDTSLKDEEFPDMVENA